MSQEFVLEERFNGGLVTSKDPADLAPGELTVCRNALYLPDDDYLHRAWGRSLQNTIVATADNAAATADGVLGLRNLQFSGDVSIMLAHALSTSVTASGAYYSDTTLIEEVTATGNTVEVAHHEGKYFVFDGANPNRCYVNNSGTADGRTVADVLDSDGGLITGSKFFGHGMSAVSEEPVLDSLAAGGTFSGGDDSAGYYDYWTTEVIKFDDGTELESTFDGSPLTVNVTGTGTTPDAPVIVRPVQTNDSSTHWRLYRSVRRDDAQPKDFPTGFRVGEWDITTVSGTDGGASSSNTGFTEFASTGDHFSQWLTATGALIEGDGSVASASATYGGGSLGDSVKLRQDYYSLSFTPTPTGKVRGIEVKVRARRTPGSYSQHNTLSVQIGIRNTGSAVFAWKPFPPNGTLHPQGLLPDITPIQKQVRGINTTMQDYVLGGPTDDWLPPDYDWNVSEVSEFLVALSAFFSWWAPAGSTTTFEVDSLTIQIYTDAGQSTAELLPFRAITVDIGGIVGAVGEDGVPPDASTGDVFEGSLVLNSVDNPTRLHWSSPGKPESFNENYTADLNPPKHSPITSIKSLGRVSVVAMRDYLYRVNYLPNEEDASFSRGKAFDLYHRTRGCVNEQAAALVQLSGKTVMAFYAYDGLFATDGYNVWELCPDIDWANPVATDTRVTNFNSVKLVNSPTEQLLYLIYQESNSNETIPNTYGANFALAFSYAARHVKQNGTLKAMGPIWLSNYDGTDTDYVRSADIEHTTNGSRLWLGYGGPNGARTYLQNSARNTGYSFPRSGDTNDNTLVTSRRIFPPGNVSHEWQLDEIYLYNNSPNGTLTLTPQSILTGAAESSAASGSFTFGANVKFAKLNPSLLTEGVRLQLEETDGTDADQRLLKYVLIGTDWQHEDSGRS